MHSHPEHHVMDRAGWLRAAVLGANDGIISTASLLMGVTASGADKSAIVMTGMAALAAGAMSMAAGEYVAVSSQADMEKSALDREATELASHPDYEHRELAGIYVERGLHPDLAHEVAGQLMAEDALNAHARDELGIVETAKARPLQAALASAISFATGAALPLFVSVFVSTRHAIPTLFTLTLVFLAILGATGAWAGRAPMLRPVLRVTFWGAFAMGVTALIGELFKAFF